MDIVTLALAKKYADEKLTNVKVDLTGYAKEDYVDAEIEELNKKIVQETGKLSEEKVDQKELENYALKDEIPTVPVQSVNGKTGAVQLSASEVGALPNSTKIPTKTSDLTNDSGFITNLVNNLANYYLKSETYTQEEINQKLSIIPKFSIKVVSSLPTSDINDTTVYLVKSGEEENNLYTEYIYVDGAWELLGKQSVDLSDYALKSDIPTALSALTNDAGFITKYVSDLENYYVKNDVYNKDEIDAKGYLTEHQDISGLAPKATTLAGYGITDGVTNEQIEQFSGTVEITSDAPTKEQTVLTVNPESETVNLYTAEEVDEKFNQLSQEKVDQRNIVQEAGESESLIMSQKAVTKLVNEALAEAEKVEYETVDSIEEMTDTSKSYVLSTDGYIYTYTETTETVTHEAENKFVPADSQINKRMGSSSLSAQNGYVWSGAIPVDLTKESPFRVKVEGTKITEDRTGSSGGYQKLWLCSDVAGNTKLSAAVIQLGDTSGNYTTLLEDGTIYADYKANAKISDSIISQTKSLRIGFLFSNSDISNTSELSGVKITFPSEAYSEEVTRKQWVSTGMKPSESGDDANYVKLLVMVNQNRTDIEEVSKRVTLLETDNDSVAIPSFWQSAVDACISKIKSLQVGRDCVTFPFFSDNHQRNGYSGMLIAHIMKECHIPYCFYGGDSISDDVVANEATMIAQDKAFDLSMAYIPNGRFCRTVGNHDGYWYDGTNKYWYSREQIYELFLREESIAQNKHFGGNGTYYYIDDISSKVRFIVLNTNTHRDLNGNIVGDNVEAEQLSWLQNVALSFAESGWAVVFISHQPISNHYHSNISNADAARTIVKNYINSTATNKADVVGWFSGHIHRDRIYTGIATNTTDDAQGTAMGFTQVTITSDHTSIAYDDATKHTVANDDKSHAIDFVTINKSTRTVNLTRLGIGNDRSYTY